MGKPYLDDLRLILHSDLSRMILCYQLMKETYEVMKTITSEIGYKFVNTVFDRDCINMGKCYRYYSTSDKKTFSLIIYNEVHEKMTIKFDTATAKVNNFDSHGYSAYANLRDIDCIIKMAEIYCYDVNYAIDIDTVANRIETSLGEGWSRIRRLNEILNVVNNQLETIEVLDSLTKGSNIYNNV